MQTCRCVLLISFPVLSSGLFINLLKIACMHSQHGSRSTTPMLRLQVKGRTA